MELQLVNQRNITPVPVSEWNQSETEGSEFVQVSDVTEVRSNRSFVEANTTSASLFHLKDECIIPVFRDNEKTISHYEFIDAVDFATHQYFNGLEIGAPQIRVSHTMNGRIPSALHKKVHELQDFEKTRYYERMMFVIEIPGITEMVNGNQLNLTVGGVRALNHESLFGKKGIEKFKVFIGFQNLVCCNLLVSTDGAALDVRVSSYDDLIKRVLDLYSKFKISKELNTLKNFGNYRLNEHQFAQIIGKSRLYQYLPLEMKKEIPALEFNDTQINTIARDYYFDKSFCRGESGDIDLWRLYGLFTGSNKSSYIDAFLNKSVNAFSFTQELTQALDGSNHYNWFLN
jgi:hypothetical protein